MSHRQNAVQNEMLMHVSQCLAYINEVANDVCTPLEE
jgi:hypothetical protein